MTSEELRQVGLDFVDALTDFYMSTHVDELPNSGAGWMTIMMNDNRYLTEGIARLTKYKKHRNEIIRTAAEGTIIGAEMAKKANTEMLAYLRNPRGTREDAEYQVALYFSRQKEAYMAIARFSPWVTGVMFLPKEREDDIGPIRYTIAKKDRAAIVKAIDNFFADELAAEERGERKDNHNAVVLAAKYIRQNLVGETYAEIKQTEK